MKGYSRTEIILKLAEKDEETAWSYILKIK